MCLLLFAMSAHFWNAFLVSCDALISLRIRHYFRDIPGAAARAGGVARFFAATQSRRCRCTGVTRTIFAVFFLRFFSSGFSDNCVYFRCNVRLHLALLAALVRNDWPRCGTCPLHQLCVDCLSVRFPLSHPPRTARNSHYDSTILHLHNCSFNLWSAALTLDLLSAVNRLF